jgi:ABC-type glycerol-3-phosphate transport system substrate-binding protein
MSHSNGIQRVLGVLALSVAFLLSSCGIGGKTDVIKVSFWGDSKEIAIIKGIIDDWSKENKDIKVVLQHIPYNQYMQKVQTEFAAGMGADVVFCEVNNFIDLYSKGILMPLDDLIAADPSIDIKDYYPELTKRFTRDGKLFVLGRDIAPFACVFYNKDLFDQAGIPYPKDDWTVKDLVEIGQKLVRKEGGITTQFGFYCLTWVNWLYTFGGGLVDNFENPTKLTITSYKSRQGIQFYHDLMYKYGISPTPNLDTTGAQLFMTGRLAMYQSGIWESPEFRTIQSFDWDVVMFPGGPDGKKSFGSGGSGYAISKTCKNPAAAWRVVKALAGRKGQISMAKTGLAQPAIRSLANSEYFAENGEKPLNKRMLDEATKYISFEPFHPNWSQFNNTVIWLNIDLYLRNEISLDEALKRIDAEFAKQGIFNK